MIASIKNALDNAPGLVLAEKKVYKKPIQATQPANYIYFISGVKTRTKTGYRQRFSFYVIAEEMETMETLSQELEKLLVGNGLNIDPSLWRILQQ